MLIFIILFWKIDTFRVKIKDTVYKGFYIHYSGGLILDKTFKYVTSMFYFI